MKSSVLLSIFLSVTLTVFSQGNGDFNEQFANTSWHNEDDVSEENQYEIYVLNINEDSINIAVLNLIEGFYLTSSSYEVVKIDDYYEIHLIDLMEDNGLGVSYYLYLDPSEIKQNKIAIFESNGKVSIKKLKKEKNWINLTRFTEEE